MADVTSTAIPVGTGRTVLIVDDDREVQRFLTERLEAEGWRVIVEKDGDWALRTFERRPVDAVILDILIPVISGFQVAERIRSLPQGRTVGILMITGIYRGAKHRTEAMGKYKLLDYLDKPVDGDKVVAILQKHFATLDAAAPETPRPPEPPPSKPANLVDEQQKKEKREVERAVATSAGGPRQMRGNVKKTSFPELLARLYRKRVTGGLFLLRDKVKKIVYFDEGHPTFIKSNVLDECLGRVLVRERMITEKECEESVQRMKEQKRQQGSVLIEMGVISPHNLRFGLETQLQIKLFDIFHWRDGEFVFRDDVVSPTDVISLELSNAQIVLEGVRRSWDAERLKAALQPLLGQYLDHAAEPELRYQDLELLPVEQGFVDSIDGTRTTKDVMKRAPAQIGERGAMALIYALHAIGVLSAREAPATIKRLQTHSGFVQLPDGAPPKEAADGRLAAFLAERRHADPFTVLGVPRDAQIDDIDRVFSSLAREFHPDRFRGQPETTARLAREAFELVAAARQELDDPDKRAIIAANLAGLAAIRAPNGTDTVADTDTQDEAARVGVDIPFEETTDPDRPGQDPATRALTADKFFKQGQEKLRARAYAEAEALFHQAVELRDDVGRYHAYFGWAVFCHRGQGARAADDALPILGRAIELSPGLEEPHLFLGMVYNAMDRPDLAEPEFEKAMQSNPDSAEALRELRLLHMRREQGR